MAQAAGYGRGARMKIETDEAEILSGVRFGVTTGAPISLMVRNSDWRNWQDKMQWSRQRAETPAVSSLSPVPATRTSLGTSNTASKTCAMLWSARAHARRQCAWRQAAWQGACWRKPECGSLATLSLSGMSSPPK